MIVDHSSSESARFGLVVGRANIDNDAVLSSADEMEQVVADYDVVIVRAPAWRRDLAAPLASVPSHVLLPADHLCYWSWERQRFTPVAAPDGFCLEETTDMSEVAPLVRDGFSDYGNHYRANPMFDPAAAVEGYCEWVERLLDEDATCLVLRSTDGEAVGFGVLDWSVETPDVRLAAMARAARGRGWYGAVLGGLMSETVQRGNDRLLISTQSDNVQVMRVWARLGLLPESTLATHHLVRRSILGH
jgi:hypothetical protein